MTRKALDLPPFFGGINRFIGQTYGAKNRGEAAAALNVESPAGELERRRALKTVFSAPPLLRPVGACFQAIYDGADHVFSQGAATLPTTSPIFYVGSNEFTQEPFTGFYFGPLTYAGTPTIHTELLVEYWDGSEWSEIDFVLDQTVTIQNDYVTTLSQSGCVLWRVADLDDWDVTDVDGRETYWVRVTIRNLVDGTSDGAMEDERVLIPPGIRVVDLPPINGLYDGFPGDSSALLVGADRQVQRGVELGGNLGVVPAAGRATYPLRLESVRLAGWSGTPEMPAWTGPVGGGNLAGTVGSIRKMLEEFYDVIQEAVVDFLWMTNQWAPGVLFRDVTPSPVPTSDNLFGIGSPGQPVNAYEHCRLQVETADQLSSSEYLEVASTNSTGVFFVFPDASDTPGSDTFNVLAPPFQALVWSEAIEPTVSEVVENDEHELTMLEADFAGAVPGGGSSTETWIDQYSWLHAWDYSAMGGGSEPVPAIAGGVDLTPNVTLYSTGASTGALTAAQIDASRLASAVDINGTFSPSGACTAITGPLHARLVVKVQVFSGGGGTQWSYTFGVSTNSLVIRANRPGQVVVQYIVGGFPVASVTTGVVGTASPGTWCLVDVAVRSDGASGVELDVGVNGVQYTGSSASDAYVGVGATVQATLLSTSNGQLIAAYREASFEFADHEADFNGEPSGEPLVEDFLGHFSLVRELRWEHPRGPRWSFAFNPLTRKVLCANGNEILETDGRVLRRLEADNDSDVADALAGEVPQQALASVTDSINASRGQFRAKPPKASFVTVYRGRVIAAKGDRFYWTFPNRGIDVWPWDFQGSIRESERADIRGLRTVNERLIAFTQYSIFEIFETTDNFLSAQPISQRGFVAQNATCVISNAGASFLAGVNADGIGVWTGSELQMILDDWDQVLDLPINASRLERSSAAYVPSTNQAFFAVPVADDEYPTRILVRELDKGIWWLWSTSYGVSELTTGRDSEGNTFLLVGYADGFVATPVRGGTDDGQPIEGSITTAPAVIPGGHRVALTDFLVTGRVMGTGTASLDFYGDSSPTPLRSMSGLTLPSGNFTLGVTELGDRPLGDREFRTQSYRARGGRVSHTLAATFTSTAQWALRAMQAVFLPKNVRGRR